MPDKFDFSAALQQLKQGKLVCREGWNGKGMSAWMYNPEASSGLTRSFLCLKDVQGGLGPWTPSTTDLLAVDWMVAE